MTFLVSNTETSHSWEYWRNRTNEMAFGMGRYVVTTGGNTAVGSASLSGTLSAGLLLANTTDANAIYSKGGLRVDGNAIFSSNVDITGNTSFSSDVDISGNVSITGTFAAGGLSLGDGERIVFGANSDFEIYHSGSHSYIHDNGTGNLRIAGNTIQLTDSLFSKYFQGSAGIATLYFSDSARIATSNSGASVTGNLDVSSGVDVTGDSTFTGNVSISGTLSANIEVSSLNNILDVNVDYGSIANSYVLTWNQDNNRWQAYSRNLLDEVSFDMLPNVNTSISDGEILVRAKNPSGNSFSGSNEGYVTATADHLQETQFTGTAGTVFPFVSTSNSLIQAYVNGVKLSNTEFSTSNTTHIALTYAITNTDIMQVVQYNPHAFQIQGADEWVSYSDRNLKRDIQDYIIDLDDLKDIGTYTYRWKDINRFHGNIEIGMIAQEVEEVYPPLVKTLNNGEKMLDYGKMTAVLLGAIQQLTDRVEYLEAKLDGTTNEQD